MRTSSFLSASLLTLALVIAAVTFVTVPVHATTPTIIEILTDPWTNNTGQYVLILGVQWDGVPITMHDGDPLTGNTVANFGGSDLNTLCWSNGSQAQNNIVVSCAQGTPYPNLHFKAVLLIPPGWSFQNFKEAYGLQGSLADLAPYF